MAWKWTDGQKYKGFSFYVERRPYEFDVSLCDSANCGAKSYGLCKMRDVLSVQQQGGARAGHIRSRELHLSALREMERLHSIPASTKATMSDRANMTIRNTSGPFSFSGRRSGSGQSGAGASRRARAARRRWS